ncbi:unnamed protein product [Durusdinium trenchii]|uniref:Uncharacterized protein n=1 Tax=Durusdinium trenchii TaxID=1381693 RepID=A0ABP0NDN9_9DINO
MTSICETLRICFRTLKGTSPGIAAETSRTRYEYELVQAGSASDLEGSDGETQKAPGTDGHPFKGPSVYFTVGIVCYHLVCAGIVAVAVLNGWISTDHGGDFAWELWALWQQLCLWTLFVQNLTRCVIMDGEALESSTATTILLYTVPFLSEPCDTMKDWVVTGICFLHAETWTGFAIGTSVVGLDALLIQTGLIPRWCRISDSLRISPPLIVLQVLYVLLLATQIHYMLFLPYFAATLFCLCDNQRDGDGTWSTTFSLSMIALTSISCIQIVIGPSSSTYSEALYECLTDGGVLAAFSVYVIVYSHLLVNLHEDCAADLRKIYRAILELPLKETDFVPQTWRERMAQKTTNLFVGLLSSSRLLIAWAENWPQGFFATLLVLRYSRGAGVGFAGCSAIVSIVKGLIIPSFQKLLLHQKWTAVETGLNTLLESEKDQQAVIKQLSTASVISATDLKDVLAGFLDKPSSDLLNQLNVGESDLFNPIKDLRREWLLGILGTDNGEEIRCKLIASYLHKGVSARELFNLGHMTVNCKYAGFTARQCMEVGGFSAGECKAAGFSVSDCIGAGFLKTEVKAAGFFAQEWKSSGFSAVQCKDVGFSAGECLAAGFSKDDCLRAGFAPAEIEFYLRQATDRD